MSRAPRSSNDRSGLAAFGVALAAGAAFLASVAFTETHPDEDAALAIGWLLSRGWLLYRDVFSHHLPTDYIPAELLASALGPSRLAARWLMLAAWAAASSALFALLRRNRDGAATAAAYTALSAAWMTYWHGNLLLIETWIGHGVVLAAAALGSPLAFSPEATPRRGLALGALLACLALASPTFLPATALVAARAAAEPAWRSRGRWLGAGAVAAGALWLAWSALHADLSLLVDHVVRFNVTVYPRFLGLRPEHPLLSWAGGVLADHARAYAGALAWTSLDRYFEGVLRLALLGWCAWHATSGRIGLAAWWLALLVALAPRAEPIALAVPFHRSPWFFAATLLVARGSVLAAPWAFRGPPARAAVGAVAAAALAVTLIPTAIATSQLREFSAPDEAAQAVKRALRECLPESARVAAFAMEPHVFVDTLREPAVPAVFYLPWQATWPPARERLLRAWDRSPPAAVYLSGSLDVWGARWESWGSDVEERLRRGYVPVVAWPPDEPERFQVWVARERGDAFVRCAAFADGRSAR
ncbi:MAG: hypothetical protein HY553_11175 [Elusimicrobia bacterium]|nr:hypothetical protein [Elusimicrobiota bacterium]